MNVPIDNVGIAMVCRAYKPKKTVRTFKPGCGAYIRFTLLDGKVSKVDIERNGCKQPCEICNTQIESARKLIEGVDKPKQKR